MLKLVVIDLSSADTDLFEFYESKVIPLLCKYRASLEFCVRSTDGLQETHLIHFPDVEQFDAFLSDPDRAALSDVLHKSGVTSTVQDVETVVYT